jgi:hypothetical protein
MFSAAETSELALNCSFQSQPLFDIPDLTAAAVSASLYALSKRRF